MWIENRKKIDIFSTKDELLDVRIDLNIFQVILFKIIKYILYIDI